MIYRLKELKGDTIAVPQLVFSKLGIAEEYNVRVALYVLATGITDPDKICADLKLRSRISAESALSFWAGAGLLERYEENAAPGEEPSAPAPMTWAEIAAASRTDPMISSLIDCAQKEFGSARFAGYRERRNSPQSVPPDMPEYPLFSTDVILLEFRSNPCSTTVG